MTNWPVVPICKKQRRDVRPGDLLLDGLYRICNTYQSGGGYDQFPAICERRLGEAGHNKQFVVQLRGCHLECPYCYVTPDGVNGQSVPVSSDVLAFDFLETNATVFHLMGGAPALHLKHWPELIRELDDRGWKDGRAVFHSDLLLSESVYIPDTIRKIAHPRALYAVNIKGLTALEYRSNTNRMFNPSRMWMNLGTLREEGVNFYITFTNVAQDHIDHFWWVAEKIWPTDWVEQQKRDAFSISLIDYEALKP